MTQENITNHEYAIPSSKIERLIEQGRLKREYLGDVETGRVILDFRNINGRMYYFHRAKYNKNFYVRENGE